MLSRHGRLASSHASRRGCGTLPRGGRCSVRLPCRTSRSDRPSVPSLTAQQVLQLLIRQYERGAKGKNSIVRMNGRLVRIRRLHTCGRLTVAYCCGASEEQARQMKVEREMIDMSVSDILHKPDRVALAAELGFVFGERETSYRWQKFRQAVRLALAAQRRADAGANDEGSSQEQPDPADQAMGAEGDDEDVAMDDDDELGRYAKKEVTFMMTCANPGCGKHVMLGFDSIWYLVPDGWTEGDSLVPPEDQGWDVHDQCIYDAQARIHELMIAHDAKVKADAALKEAARAEKKAAAEALKASKASQGGGAKGKSKPKGK